MRGQGGEHVFHVQAGGFHQRLFKGLAVERKGQLVTRPLDALAYQAKSIGMHAVRCQAQHHVSGAHALAGQNFGFFYRADGKTGQIVFACGVHAGHLGRFAANQRATRQLTSLGDTTNHGRGRVNVELAAGKVIQKEQGLGTLHQHIVDAHGDQVDTHGVVHIPFERQLELGADAVGAAHQHRFLVAFRHLKQRTEATNPS